MVPEEYDTPEVQEALEEWLAWYRELTRRGWSNRSAKMFFNRAKREGWVARDVEASIYHSIEMGYRGIFRQPQAPAKKGEDPPWVPDTRKGYDTPWVIGEEN